MEYQSRHQKESDLVRLVHWYDTYVSDPRKRTSSELPQVSERNGQQGQPNQINRAYSTGQVPSHTFLLIGRFLQFCIRLAPEMKQCEIRKAGNTR